MSFVGWLVFEARLPEVFVRRYFSGKEVSSFKRIVIEAALERMRHEAR